METRFTTDKESQFIEIDITDEDWERIKAGIFASRELYIAGNKFIVSVGKRDEMPKMQEDKNPDETQQGWES